MAVPLSELELELEGELEDEWEGEDESEAFFGGLARLAQRAVSSPTLRTLALNAGKAALKGGLDSLMKGVLGDSEYELEGEGEGEDEWELESASLLSPIRRVYPDALMEHLGHAAAETESEAEAEAFIGALVPLAAKLIPKVAPMVMKHAPTLIKGLTGATRTLRRNPSTRPLVRTLPTVMRRTAQTMAKQTAQGRPVTAKGAARTLAQQTSRVLASPTQCVRAYQRSRALDRTYHRACPHAAPRVAAPAPAVARRQPVPRPRVSIPACR